jgi:hypothetical protein
VELADALKLTAWRMKYLEARKSNDIITRFEAMLAVLKCAETLGGDYLARNSEWGWLNDKIGTKGWDECVLVPDPNRFILENTPFKGGGFEDNPDVQNWPENFLAYIYPMWRASLVSGKPLFDYSEQKNSMRASDNLTYTEGLLAALRLLESNDYSAEFTMFETAAAQRHTIPKALYTGKTDLPEASNKKLPAWRGTQIGTMGWVFASDDMSFFKFIEDDFEIMSDLGFNFVRAGWTPLMLNINNHVKPGIKDGYLMSGPEYINIEWLEDLDRGIEYAMKHGIHFQLAMVSVPGYRQEQPPALEYFLSNTTAQEWVLKYWRMLAHRYADIPNNYLSFNLMNEVPITSDEEYARIFNPIIDAIWEESPGRVIVADIHSDGITGESMAKKGVALSRHMYPVGRFDLPLNELGDMDMYPNYKNEITWPAPYLPICIDEVVKYTFEGNFSDAELILGISYAPNDAYLIVTSGDKEIYNKKISNNGKHGGWAADKWYEVKEEVAVKIPKDVKKFTVSSKGSFSLNIARVIIRRKGKKDIMLTPNDHWIHDHEAHPERVNTVIKINDNGSVDAIMMDWELLKTLDGAISYENIKAVAKKYGVGFMVNEIGCTMPQPFFDNYMKEMITHILTDGVGYALGGSVGDVEVGGQLFGQTGSKEIFVYEIPRARNPKLQYAPTNVHGWYLNLSIARFYAELNGVDVKKSKRLNP